MGTKHRSSSVAFLAVLAVLIVAWLPASAVSPDAHRHLSPRLQSQPPSIVLNEFLASNASGLLDEDGDASDWIELHNTGTTPIDLAGWSLTDDATLPRKWVFPQLSLAAQQYLVVFASGKNRTTVTPGLMLHTNFKLSADGEYLALFDATNATQPVDAFAPTFPQQYTDISYGRTNQPSEYRYFAHPTPGQANDLSSAYLGVVADVQFSAPRGFYEEPFFVELSTSTPGASIRLTVDGSAPTADEGRLYTQPVYIYTTTVLRAIAYKPGYLSSHVQTHSYIFLNDVLQQPPDPSGFPPTWGTYDDQPVPADYAMDQVVVTDPRYAGAIRDDLRALPALSLATSPRDMFDADVGIYANPMMEGRDWERPGSVEMILPDGSTAFQAGAGVRIHGGESRRPDLTAKHSLRIYFRSEYGTPVLAYDLFGGSAVDTFSVLVLRNNFGDSWLYGRTRATYLRDQWTRDTQLAMGSPASSGRFVHLYVNGLYWGVYNIIERLDDKYAASYFGGDPEDYDIIKGLWPNAVEIDSGDDVAWNAMMDLASAGLASDAQYAAIQQYLDVPNLIDYMVGQIYAGTYAEWPWQNWTAIRKREPGAGFMFFFWDTEFTLEDVNENIAGLGEDAFNSPAYLYYRLRDNAEFRLLFADHLQRHFFDGGALFVDSANPQWDPQHPEWNAPAARFVQRANEIDRAIVGESARWGDWHDGWLHYGRDDYWAPERDRLLADFFPQRSEIVLQQFRDIGLYPDVAAPVFNQHGGVVPPGFRLAMTAPAGTIYYTTNGSDPRVAGTGAVSPSARAYQAPVVLAAGAVTVKARTLSGTTWSALNEATFSNPQDLSTLRIAEIMYNPAGGNDFEFIELKNTGAEPLSLEGVAFVTGIAFTFPAGATLPAGRFAVLVYSPAAFAQRYPGVPIAGQYSGKLANEGEQLVLAGPDGQPLIDMTYDDEAPWPTSPDGSGYSLVIVDDLADPTLPGSWRASAAVNGSPGQNDPIPQPTATPTATATATPSPTATATPTLAATATPSPTATVTPSPTATASPTPARRKLYLPTIFKQ